MFLNKNLSLSVFSCSGSLETMDGGLEHILGAPGEQSEFWQASNCTPRRRHPGSESSHTSCLNRKIERYVTRQGLLPFRALVKEVDTPLIIGHRKLPWVWGEDGCFE